MISRGRGSGKRFISVVGFALLLPVLGSCAPAVGGGVLVTVVAIGALTSHCYDYVDVTVLDPQGRKTCAATVTASNDGDEFELKSCYYAPLTDGHWLLRAKLAGFPDTVSQLEVDHANDCTRHVQSMELTLASQGSGPAGDTPFPRAPIAAQPAPPLSPSASSLPLPPPPPPPPNAAPPANSAAPPSPPSSAAPAASAPPPSVGVFPDQAPRPSPAK
jgi:hypothetical protein